MREHSLPAGWESVKLGEICAITSGHGFKFNEYSNAGVKLLRINNVTFGQIIWDQIAFLPEHYIQEYPKLVLNEGDILIALNRPILGNQLKIGIMKKNDSPAILYQRVGRIDIRDNKKIDPIFLYILMRTSFFLKQLAAKLSGSDQPYINPTEMVKITIPLPPLPVQRQIVAVLEQAEAVKRQRQEADALTGVLLQSVFYEMFGDPVRNELGWVFARLDELCSIITDGEHVTPRRTDSGIFLLSARNIQNHYISTTDVDFIDEEEYTRLSKHLIPQNGDVLVSCSGTVGRVTRVNVDYKFQLVRSVAIMRPIMEKIDPIYLEYSFDTQFMEDQISKCVHQSSQANLFQGMIRKLSIPLPPLALQQQFALVVQDIERIRERQEESKREIDVLFDGLMAGAFGGELAG
jgi:type I restriction enzyme S subunit